MISPQCAVIDLKVGAWDGIEQCSIEDKTRLEMQVDDVLFDMLSSGLIRYNEDQDFWVLVKGENDQNLPRIINWISSTGGQLPQHLLLEISEEKLKQRLKNEQERATTA